MREKWILDIVEYSHGGDEETGREIDDLYTSPAASNGQTDAANILNV